MFGVWMPFRWLAGAGLGEERYTRPESLGTMKADMEQEAISSRPSRPTATQGMARASMS